MDRATEQRRGRSQARRQEALLAAVRLLAKLQAIQTRVAGARASKSAVVHGIDRLEAAVDGGSGELEDVFCELADLLDRLERELDEEERLAAQAVMYRLAGYIDPANQAVVLGR